MKATINPSNLLKELKKMAIVVQKNTVLPIIKSVKFEFENNKLTLTGTDMETTYISKIDCQCSEKFNVLMEHSDITEICGNVVSPLEINVDEKLILFVSGKWKGKLSLMGDAEMFPKIPEDEFDISFDADSDFFWHLAIASNFKSPEDPRFNMAAIDICKKIVTVIATDSNSLYKKELPIEVGKELCIMIPNNFISACKYFQESKVSIGEKFIKAEYKDEIIIGRLSEQKFPNYKSVIKNGIEYNLTTNREKLRSAISSISVAATLQFKQIVLSFTPTDIKLKTQDIDLNKEAETEMEVENLVGIDSIGFNADKMNKFLSVLTSENVDLCFTSPSNSIYLRPSDDESIFCLLQPVVIQNN